MALAGPFGTALLADMGANIIKVEPPHGDNSRPVPPIPPDYANVRDAHSAGIDYGGYFASINRNKRSIVLDLKQASDREILMQLCERADAVVENMRVGVMDKLGVGYEAIAARNPQIVYGAIRGFGDPRTGESPYSEWPAFDIVAQSMSGHVSITGPEEELGYPSGVSIGDIYPGTLMALGVLAAIHDARATGVGQFVDVAMYDAMLALTETLVANYGFEKKQLTPRGRHHPNLMPFGLFPTTDGLIAIAAPGNEHWELLCRAMDRQDLMTDERTKNTFLRRKNQTYVEAQISAWTSRYSKQEVAALLGGEVPCGPVNTAEDIFNDPHVRAREMITEFQLPGDNPKVSIVGSPIKYTKTPSGFRHRAPKLNEHAEEIRNEFDISQR